MFQRQKCFLLRTPALNLHSQYQCKMVLFDATPKPGVHKMNKFVTSTLVIVSLLMGGCVTAPQTPVALSKEALFSNSGRIGVAMTVLPKVDTSIQGAGCLLCYGIAVSALSELTTHAQTLSYEDLPKLKEVLAELLRKRGADVIIISDPIDIKTLESSEKAGPNVARLNFTPFQQKYKIDRLLLIDINSLGFLRTYSQYFPTSDPKAYLKGFGYMVNLKTNTYEWYMPVNITKSADMNWDEPPQFPGLSNAYFQVLELGKDTYIQTFKN
jgi:hypothetical protein